MDEFRYTEYFEKEVLINPISKYFKKSSLSGLTGQSMVRQAHHDTCHPEPVEGWIPLVGE